jgi:hypothetical protein
LNLPQRTYPNGFTDGYELLFNLQTAELISVTKNTVDSDSMIEYMEKIDPLSICNIGEIGVLQPNGEVP